MTKRAEEMSVYEYRSYRIIVMPSGLALIFQQPPIKRGAGGHVVPARLIHEAADLSAAIHWIDSPD